MTYQLHSDCPAKVCEDKGAPFVVRSFVKLKQWLAGVTARYRRDRQARIDRAAFNQMLLLDDDILDDIGVTRANVLSASQLPIHQSAAQALEATKKRSRPKIRH